MNRRIRVVVVILIVAALTALVVFIAAQEVPETYDASCGRIFVDRNGRLLRVALTDDEQMQIPISFKDGTVATGGCFLIDATIAAEDKRFYRHPGVDPLAAARAVAQAIRRGGAVSGASTLTMQAARLHRPSPRTFGSKLREAAVALKIECVYSKRWILDYYLNRAPYGGNIVGAGAAAHAYFSVAPSELTLPQAALLAGLPKHPNGFHPLRHPDRTLSRRNDVLALMRRNAMIDDTACADAQRAPLGLNPSRPPFHAPHLTDWAMARRTEPGVHRLSVDLDAQILLESVLARHRGRLNESSIHNGAALVIENRDARVRAFAGNLDYFDAAHSGQVNCAFVPRSTGSALKPFLYLREIAAGELLPGRPLPDVPTRYPGLTPENFNRRYEGAVTAEVALQQSLNVPAMRLLERAGVDRFLSYLRAFGVSGLYGNADHYGLGLVTGSAELSLFDLSGAYLALAREGWAQNLDVESAGAPPKDRQVESAAAVYVVNRMLSTRTRGEADAISFSYKTGTSHGYRDAWCFGYTPDFTVAVWLGNCDRSASPVLTGAQSALPIVRDMFAALYRGRDVGDWPRPPEVDRASLCAVSGQVPTDACPAVTKQVWIQDVTLVKHCDIHRRVGGRSVEVWPAEIARFFESRGSRHAILSGDTPSDPLPDKLLILTPIPDETYYVDPLSISGRILTLRGAVPSDADTVFWFVDGRYHGAGTPQLYLTPGRHTVYATDSRGRSAWSAFHVTAPTSNSLE